MKGLVIALWLMVAIPWICIMLNAYIAKLRNDNSGLPADIAMAILPLRRRHDCPVACGHHVDDRLAGDQVTTAWP